MAASTWRPPYLPHELRGRGLTRPERDAEWRRGSSPPNPGVECLVTGTSARGGGGGGSGCKAGALAIKPEAAALITVFGAGQLRGACWSRSRTSLSRPALCLLVGGPRGERRTWAALPPPRSRPPGLASSARAGPGRARRGGARRAEVGGRGVTRRAAGTGILGPGAFLGGSPAGWEGYRPATEAALPGASRVPAAADPGRQELLGSCTVNPLSEVQGEGPPECLSKGPVSSWLVIVRMLGVTP